MAFRRIDLLLSMVLLIFLNACILIDGASDDNGVVVCDLFAKYDSEKDVLKVKASFFIEDSLGNIPYFLDNPVLLDKMEMRKGLVEGEGLFYEEDLKVEKNQVVSFSFKDIKGRLYKEEITIRGVDVVDICPMYEGQVVHVSQEKEVSLLLVDPSKKLITFSSEGKERILLDDRISKIDSDSVVPIFILKEKMNKRNGQVELRYRYEGIESYGVCKIKR